MLMIAGASATAQQPKIYIAFQWHMHQPLYTPGETVIETHNSGSLSYDLIDVFTSRTGAYTNWPSQAVNKLIDANLPGGAQVSFSGSLVENLNVLEAETRHFANWKSHWNTMAAKRTDLGNPRIDMVAFGYYHPLMALIDRDDIERQISKHRECFATNFPEMGYSKGIFPPENAFEEHMIPALVNQGIEWALVDNSHFDRAAASYPWSNGTSIVEPNKADVLNANPADWSHIDGLYCPAPISTAWGHRPHWMKYVDPADGREYRMIAVPTSLVFGNEDGRGGFGALQYEKCISQLEPFNTDPEHPILVVLHHDGDNHGGGSASYYGSNFQNFVQWLQDNPTRFECTTVQDYLDRFPPEDDDIIHVEAGSWWGAGADPEFLKWNGDKGDYKGATGPYSPDHNSWGIITAASNIVRTASAIAPDNANVAKAWDALMTGETSCYWYWDGTEEWDSKPATAANIAVNLVSDIIASGSDKIGPSIYHPQREPYNPGATEWKIAQPSDFTVWSYVYDFSGLESVKLKYRIDKDGINPLDSNQNETYEGGSEVGPWQEIEMTPSKIESITNPKPIYKADEYSAKIEGLKGVLVDYYIEATDTKGNVSRTIILHVWVGDSQVGPDPGDDPVTTLGSYTVTPAQPTANDEITITAANGAAGIVLHWGVGDWNKPIEAYLPAGSVYHSDNKAARTPFKLNADGKYEVKIGPFNNPAQEVSYISFVTNTGNSWDNNGGNDYKLVIQASSGIDRTYAPEGALSAFISNDRLVVNLPSQESSYHVTLTNIAGAEAMSAEMSASSSVADATVVPGIYILSARNLSTGMVHTVKVSAR